MKKVIFLALAAPTLLLFSCSKTELDPLQLDKITKGSLICLRGDAVSTINDPANSGACDLFSLANIADETFDIQAAYLAEDLTNLAEVEYFAKLTPNGTRARVAVFDGAEWMATSADKYPLATIKIKASDILAALGNPTLEASEGLKVTYLFLEADLKLKDGSVIAASSIVNQSLFQTPLFFPAMNLQVKIVD